MSQQAAKDLLGYKLCSEQFIVPLSYDNDVITIAHSTKSIEPSLRAKILQRTRHAAIKVEAMDLKEITMLQRSLWEQGSDKLHPTLSTALEYCLDNGSEDLMLEVTREGGKLRAITSGNPKTIATFDGEVYDSIRLEVSQKSFGRDEPRSKQRGRFNEIIDGRHIYTRVLSVPVFSAVGKKAPTKLVMRLQRPDYLLPQIHQFGFDERQLKLLLQLVASAGAGVAIAAPPGHGKTSLACRIMKTFSLEHENAYTIEHPVEIALDDVTQMLIDEDHGFTMEDAIRELVGLSPSLVFVGEALDGQSSQLAMRALSAGIPCLLSSHAKDAAEIPYRLASLGIDPDSIADLSGVVAIRLLPELCPDCSVDAVPSPRQAALLKRYPTLRHAAPKQRSMNRDCLLCRGSGVRGREPVAEVFEVTDRVKDAIRASDYPGIRKELHTQGLPTMLDHALNLYAQGKVDERDLRRHINVGFVTDFIDPDVTLREA